MLEIKELLEREFDLEDGEDAAKAILAEFGKDEAIIAIKSVYNSYHYISDYSEILDNMFEDHFDNIIEFTEEQMSDMNELDIMQSEEDTKKYLMDFGWRIYGDIAIAIDLNVVENEVI